MPVNSNPVFRQEIVPWYDSQKACLLVLIIMGITLLFSLAGISVANETVENKKYIWVPLLTMILSIGVIFSIVLRLFKRYISQFQK